MFGPLTFCLARAWVLKFVDQRRHWTQDAILKHLLLIIASIGLTEGHNHAVDKAED